MLQLDAKYNSKGGSNARKEVLMNINEANFFGARFARAFSTLLRPDGPDHS